MPFDFVANDFGAIARAMKRHAASSGVVLHFWGVLTRLTSMHESVEAAVEEAYALVTHHIMVVDRITTIDGTVLLDDDALSAALERYREGLPV